MQYLGSVHVLHQHVFPNCGVLCTFDLGPPNGSGFTQQGPMRDTLNFRLELHPIRPTVDLSNHQDWSPFILTLELHPIRPNEDHCGPVLPPRLVSLHPYLGTPPNKAQRGPLWTCPTTRTGLPSSLPWKSTQ